MAKYKDIKDKRFGRLTALEIVGKYNRSTIWKCKCECGNIIVVPINRLSNGETKSCGCLKSDYCKNDLNCNIKQYQVDGTNVAYIKSSKLSKSNKSGVRGVCKKKNGKWLAQIVFKKKAYNLGTYEKFEDAVKARKDAEEKYFNNFLESLDNK